jgi:hypothetical protein
MNLLAARWTNRLAAVQGVRGIDDPRVAHTDVQVLTASAVGGRRDRIRYRLSECNALSAISAAGMV